MAHYEVIVMTLSLMLLVGVLAKAAYDTGYKKGNTNGFNYGTKAGEEVGHCRGLSEGKAMGFREYRRLEVSLYERDKARKKALLAEERTEKEQQETEMRMFVDSLNEKRIEEEQIPYEILLAYGVSQVDQLPLFVREAYNITKTGGVVDGE